MTRGFSLLEVMVAGALFVVAVSGMTVTLTAASSTGVLALHQNAARDIARQRIEELLAVASTADALSIGTHSERRNLSGAVDAAGLFTVTWNVTAHPQLPVQKIDLGVDWTEPNGTRHVGFETMR